MSDTLPTVEVVNPQTGGKMIINESDYDPDEYELWGVAVTTPGDEPADGNEPADADSPEDIPDVPCVSEVAEAESKRQRRRGRNEVTDNAEQASVPKG